MAIILCKFILVNIHTNIPQWIQTSPFARGSLPSMIIGRKSEFETYLCAVYLIRHLDRVVGCGQISCI